MLVTIFNFQVKTDGYVLYSSREVTVWNTQLLLMPTHTVQKVSMNSTTNADDGFHQPQQTF